MNKKVKSLILGATMIMALPIIGGCGGNNIGYVDSQKIMTQTSKSIEINKEINAKGKELQAKVDAADAEAKLQVMTEAKQDFDAFSASKTQELKQYVDQQVNELAKEKKLDVVKNIFEYFNSLSNQNIFKNQLYIAQVVKYD